MCPEKQGLLLFWQVLSVPVTLAEKSRLNKMRVLHYTVPLEMLLNSIMKHCETNFRQEKALVKTGLFNGMMVPFREVSKFILSLYFCKTYK